METTVSTLKDQIQKLQEQQQDLENRTRRQNLRIIGIPEDAEKGRPTDFMSGFFSEVLGKELPDRAHRTLAPKPRARDRPRAMIICTTSLIKPRFSKPPESVVSLHFTAHGSIFILIWVPNWAFN